MALKLKGIRATLSMPTMDSYSRKTIAELCDEVERLRSAIELHRARTLQERGLCRAADGNLWSVLNGDD